MDWKHRDEKRFDPGPDGKDARRVAMSRDATIWNDKEFGEPGRRGRIGGGKDARS